MKKILTLILAVAAHIACGQLSFYTLPNGLTTTPSEIVTFQNNLYMVVNTGPRDGFKLCKFDGVNFTVIENPLPGKVVSSQSPLQVYHDNLYLIITDLEDEIIPPAPMLYRFDGTNYTRIDIPFDRVPTTFTHSDLEVYHDKLFIDVAVDETSPITAWVTYDGTSFSLIEFPFHGIDQGASGMTVYHDELFCQMEAMPGGAGRLISSNGLGFRLASSLDLVQTKFGIYNDKLILTQSTTGHGQLTAFDGTTATTIASPGVVPANGGKEVYRDLLFLRMAAAATPDLSNLLMAYNGSTFSHILSINGIGEDFEVWNDYLYFTATNRLYKYRPVALGPFYDFERLDINLFANDRSWCWNSVIIDWTINPVCLTPPLCPDDYPIDAAVYDKDKVIWEAIEKKPFDLTIPVADNPYTFSLASNKTGVRQPILTVDPSLVGMGLETIKLSAKPQQNDMTVSLSTKKNQTVPVTVSFLDAKDAVVWEETLTAPVEKQLTVKPTAPGVKWLIAPAGATLESAGITSAKYYPNPFDGKITVELQTKGGKIPVQVTIDDPNGKRVIDASLTAPVQQTLEVKDKKPGFYVLTFVAGGARRRVVIELK